SRRCASGGSDGRGRRTSLPSDVALPPAASTVRIPYRFGSRLRVLGAYPRRRVAQWCPLLGVPLAGSAPEASCPVRTPHGERFPVSAAEPSPQETSGFACSPRGEFAFVDPLTSSSTTR